MRRLSLILATLGLAACSAASGSGGSGSGAPVPLLDQAGSGFTQKLDVALGLDNAASATPAAAAATKQELRGQGYAGGEERVFIKGDEYVTVLELELSTEVGAADVVRFESARLSSSLGARVYPDSQVPGAQAFDLSGQTRAGGHDAFCQGVWFAAGTQAYEVADCASSPRYPDLALSLALKQYRKSS